MQTQLPRPRSVREADGGLARPPGGGQDRATPPRGFSLLGEHGQGQSCRRRKEPEYGPQVTFFGRESEAGESESAPAGQRDPRSSPFAAYFGKVRFLIK